MQTFSRLFTLFLLLGGISASGVTIDTAYTRFYEEGEIRPIGQYFGGKLSRQGYRSVIASQAEDPAGQYFIIRLKEWKSASVAEARMTLFATDSKEPSQRSWQLSGKKLDDWLYLGLTGTDWPSEGVRPLAWRVELLDAEGNILADWKSFLWEMPE